MRVERKPMSAKDEYQRMWDLLVETHRTTHGKDHLPVRDFNCCSEYAVIMALRSTSTLDPEYPGYLLDRISALDRLDRHFYVESILATDGEPVPSDPEPLREYRASRRYHVLWSELKAAAARIEELERALHDATRSAPSG